MKKLEKQIGIEFKNKNLLKTAFTHRSHLNENRDIHEHNERLEFLGDAVLELVVTEYLYNTYPDSPEGDMTNWRSALVKGNNLSEVAEKLNLGDYLLLSRGEELSGGRKKPYLLANALESLIGAVYIEKGYKITHAFIEKFILKQLTEILEKGLHIDGKSLFQEMAQGKLNTTPHYILLSETGPDHNKVFTMGAYIGENLIAKGHGASKQKAEENAATEAIKAKGWAG